jgi:hypothetical protein
MQAQAIFVLVAIALAVGTLAQTLPSETLVAERALLGGGGAAPMNSCPGPWRSVAYRICTATLELKTATDDETRSSALSLRASDYEYQHRYYLALRDFDAAIALKGASRES